MCIVKNPQLHFGEIDINPCSRDDIPTVLKGLQYIYTNKETRKKGAIAKRLRTMIANDNDYSEPSTIK